MKNRSPYPQRSAGACGGKIIVWLLWQSRSQQLTSTSRLGYDPITCGRQTDGRPHSSDQVTSVVNLPAGPLLRSRRADHTIDWLVYMRRRFVSAARTAPANCQALPVLARSSRTARHLARPPARPPSPGGPVDRRNGVEKLRAQTPEVRVVAPEEGCSVGRRSVGRSKTARSSR